MVPSAFRFCDRQGNSLPHELSSASGVFFSSFFFSSSSPPSSFFLLLLLLLLLLQDLHINILSSNLRHYEYCSGVGTEFPSLDWKLGVSQVLYIHEVSQKQIHEFSLNSRSQCSSGRRCTCLIPRS